jgi:hypothetical protein
MLKLVIIGLLLSGCVTVPEDANCSFWNGKPYDSSQDAWRDFDCPYVDSANRKGDWPW